MILDLESVFNTEGLSKEFEYELDLSGEEISGSRPFTSPVKVSGCVSNSTDIVELKAKADYAVELDCDRCAKPIRLELSTKINHTLVTSLNDETNDELVLVNELRFELDELVIEDTFLSLPVKFLCKEDCKGICPSCGKDLNQGECGCKKEVDPRWAALNQLLDK